MFQHSEQEYQELKARYNDAIEKNAALRAKMDDVEGMAKVFHDAYERIAPVYSYETRRESALPWNDIKPNLQKLMIETCRVVSRWLKGEGE